MISSPSARGDKIRNIKGTFVKIKIFTNLHRTTSPDAILYELGLHTQSFLTEEAERRDETNFEILPLPASSLFT